MLVHLGLLHLWLRHLRLRLRAIHALRAMMASCRLGERVRLILRG